MTRKQRHAVALVFMGALIDFLLDVDAGLTTLSEAEQTQLRAVLTTVQAVAIRTV